MRRLARWVRRLCTPTRPVRTRANAFPCPPGVEALEGRLLPTAYTVTTTKDLLGDSAPGEVTLRDVLTAIDTQVSSGNAWPGSATNTVSFAIGAPGSVQTIAVGGGNVAAGLPALTGQAFLDGWSQGGTGYTGPPLVVLTWSLTPTLAPGLELDAGSDGSTVRGLVVNGPFGIGILLNASSGNLITGNYVGTDATGTAAVPVRSAGVALVGGATANTVGGTAPGSGNVLSGNGSYGLNITGSATSGNVVLGNRIGTDPTGRAALGNGSNGVALVGATANTIGGTAAGAANVISANGNDGVAIWAGASGNVVLGNRIGTDVTGTRPLGNAYRGVELFVGASSNTVGGAAAGAGNVISASGNVGVAIEGDEGLVSSGNVVLGNRIGTDVTGTVKLGNRGVGVSLNNGANGNTIGGTDPGAGNVISGNGFTGVDLHATASDNVILGNRIGTDAAGAAKLANQGDGIVISFGSVGNTIGGAAPGAGNVISGNAGRGVDLEDLVGGTSPPAATVVLGNLIGTDATGSFALGNAGDGMDVDSLGNTIGAAGAGNVISGNGGEGLRLSGENVAPDATAGERANDNLVQGNFIGTDRTGAAGLGNRKDGVHLGASARDNTIGGTAPGAGNVVSGNGGNGIEINDDRILVVTLPPSGNVLLGNLIGTDRTGTAPLGNAADGVRLTDDTTADTVGGTAAGAGNVIASNAKGVVVYDRADGDSILGNSIFGDVGPGIDIGDDGPTPNGGNPRDFPNGGQNTPVLTGATLTSVTGSLTSIPDTSFRVEFFATPADQGPWQGKTFLGSLNVTTNGNGYVPFTAVLTVPLGANVSATATNLSTGDTSEFSAYVSPGALATYTVTTTKDLLGDTTPGEVTLRDVLAAIDTRAPSGNAPPGGAVNVVQFAIGAPGSVQTISLSSALPAVARQVLIDGWSQGGTGYGGPPLIVLRGAGRGATTLELDAGSDGSTVRGLVFDGDFATGIDVNGSNRDAILGDYFGLDATGTALLGAGHADVSLRGGATANTVGGTTAAARNVFAGSGSGTSAVNISGTATTGNLVAGNSIGTDRTGRRALGSLAWGVTLAPGTTGNTVGGTAAGAGNVIAGAVAGGVEVSGSGSLVAGNFIGTDRSGSARLGNADGVVIDGAAALNTVGGTAAGAGNVIAYNAKGVVVRGTAAGDSVLGNSIFANTGPGIDLGDDGPTANGANPRAFPNRGQNTPVFTALTLTTVSGTLKSIANTAFRVEIFASPGTGPTGQGMTLLGAISVMTKADGTASFTAAVSTIPAGNVVTATATDLATGDTSELSPVGTQLVVLTNPVIASSGATQMVALRAQLFSGSAPPFGAQISFTVVGLPGSVTGTVDADGLVKVRFPVPAGTRPGQYTIVARYTGKQKGDVVTATGLLTVLPG